jgi:hypothetical protein
MSSEFEMAVRPIDGPVSSELWEWVVIEGSKLVAHGVSETERDAQRAGWEEMNRLRQTRASEEVVAP